MSAASILDSLRRLDAQLLRMVEYMRVHSGREPGADPFRGLYISEPDVLRDLNAAEAPEGGGSSPLAAGPAFEALRTIYRLSQFELDALLIAIAPEISPRYERIFGYLQDDVSRRRPCIDLILSLLCGSGADRLSLRARFESAGALRANRLVRLLGDELVPAPRRELYPDPRIVAFVLDQTGLDLRLAPFVTLRERGDTGLTADPGLVNLAVRATSQRAGLRIFFRGTDRTAKTEAATALAEQLGRPLLMADLARAGQSLPVGGGIEDRLDCLAREALLRNAIVYLDHLDSVTDEAGREAIFRSLETVRGIAILSGTGDPPAGTGTIRGLITISFGVPEWGERRAAWKSALRNQGMRAKSEVLDSLAECFRFNRGEIDRAAETAAILAEYRGELPRPVHAFEAARLASGSELAALTRKVVPAHGWHDMVLPPESMEQLSEICRRVARRHQVLGRWGFERRLSGGKGINALFHGHSGTGKTMAAEVVAHELQIDLYKIDLAGVVSKYIGETEKNLDRIFAAAENANAILLFDEADALFGKRSEVRDAHDRYANLEVSYLLQKMEQHEGISILSTNLRQNLDEAFLRRLTFTVPFPFPDEQSRARIWRGIWPKEAPLASDVDADWLAARFLLSGGNIRNVALSAAYLAVEDDSIVRLDHVLRAVQKEFHKLGKTLTAAELAPPLALTGAAA
jgi:SpoVK/Ycf46/Vps4 family AAA+-type ATPase